MTRIALIAGLCLPLLAQARVYDIYRADSARGAWCVVIGGACASETNFSSGLFVNPASLEASNTGFGIGGGYNGSSNLELGMKGSNVVKEASYLGGFALAGSVLGIGAELTGYNASVTSRASVTDDNNATQILTIVDSSRLLFLNVPLAIRFGSKLSMGVALLMTSYTENLTPGGTAKSSSKLLDATPRMALSYGAIFAPSKTFRYGFAVRGPLINYVNLSLNTSAFGNVISYSEDFALALPWVLAQGFTWLPWAGRFKISLDLDVIGKTPNGFFMSHDTFTGSISDKGLTAHGRKLAFEPRIGLQSPFLLFPSRSTMYLGSYYENSRLDGIAGRIHATGGLSVKLHIFKTIEPLVGFDYAKSFFQMLITVR